MHNIVYQTGPPKLMKIIDTVGFKIEHYQLLLDEGDCETGAKSYTFMMHKRYQRKINTEFV